MTPRELELKAVVSDPAALQARLERAGASPGFRGRMTDRRYDLPGSVLLARDQVLRVRTYEGADGRPRAEVAWKGPTAHSGGYKAREELQLETDDPVTVAEILGRLGYVVSELIERSVAFYRVEGAVLRLEWYPRMDVLVEVEGEPAAIERAVAASGIGRECFTADRLLDFAGRYEARTGRKAALALKDLEPGEAPGWPSWARRLVTEAPTR